VSVNSRFTITGAHVSVNSRFTITVTIIPVFASRQRSNSCNSESLYYWRYYSD